MIRGKQCQCLLSWTNKPLPWFRDSRPTEQRSAGEVIHDALAIYAAAGKRPLPKGAGKYRSGRSDTSANVDEILTDAVKEGLWP